MAKGFADYSQLGSKKIATISKSHPIRRVNLALQRHILDLMNPEIYRYFTEEQLFTPPTTYSFNDYGSTGHSNNHPKEMGCSIIERLAVGHWSLIVYQDKNSSCKYCEGWGFTISAWTGERYLFHPEQIRDNIMEHHSYAVYEKWKQVVLADLPNFAHALDCYNPPRDLYSLTSCRSSERLCRRLNLNVQFGHAFLRKDNRKQCMHKEGTYQPLCLA